MKTRLLLVLMLGLIGAAPLFAARTILYYENECCRNITEGEFAILYAQGLKLREPAQGWTVQAASSALSALGHQPEKGWVLSRFLSEAVMAGLLRNSDFHRPPFNSPQFERSNLLVTVAKARGVFPAEDTISQGEFAVLLAQALQVQAPRGGWTTENAVQVLESQPVPIKPVKGWNVNAPLKESDMTQVLAPTAYRPTSIDPGLDISPIQAYSLLFGKFEIATEGHFGVFLVKSLGVSEPAGGWSKQAALNYLKNEFGVESGYGWSPNAPLCVQTFEDTLRKILLSLRTGSGAPTRQSNQGSARLNSVRPPNALDGGSLSMAARSEQARRDAAAPPRDKEVESFIKDLRRNGLIPGDPCATIPVQALIGLGAPLGRTEQPPPPASSFVPPLE